ncbi:hypothetical protein Pfo_010163, partial [Paulownia fortunei]
FLFPSALPLIPLTHQRYQLIHLSLSKATYPLCSHLPLPSLTLSSSIFYPSHPPSLFCPPLLSLPPLLSHPSSLTFSAQYSFAPSPPPSSLSHTVAPYSSFLFVAHPIIFILACRYPLPPSLISSLPLSTKNNNNNNNNNNDP